MGDSNRRAVGNWRVHWDWMETLCEERYVVVDIKILLLLVIEELAGTSTTFICTYLSWIIVLCGR